MTLVATVSSLLLKICYFFLCTLCCLSQKLEQSHVLTDGFLCKLCSKKTKPTMMRIVTWPAWMDAAFTSSNSPTCMRTGNRRT